MIFGAKIFRLDLLFLLYQDKRKNSLDNRPLVALILISNIKYSSLKSKIHIISPQYCPPDEGRHER
jgi:hypothetical protein